MANVSTHVGLMLTTVLPLLDLTHSLLMNSPVGCVYLTPFGAVSSIESPDMARDFMWGSWYLAVFKVAVLRAEWIKGRRKDCIETVREGGEEGEI